MVRLVKAEECRKALNEAIERNLIEMLNNEIISAVNKEDSTIIINFDDEHEIYKPYKQQIIKLVLDNGYKITRDSGDTLWFEF